MQQTVTLGEHLASELESNPGLVGISQAIEDLALAGLSISNLVGKGALAGVFGSAQTENIQGEIQKKLDVISNDVMIDTLSGSGHWAGLASEEMDEVLPIESEDRGEFLCLFDPLDGSTNIEVNVTIGTIFSILRNPQGRNKPSEADFLQPGKRQIAAGYLVYGPSTTLVLTLGRGVNGFTLDRDSGKYLLSHPDMGVPEATREYAVNASNQRFWAAPVRRYIDECNEGSDGPRGRDFNMRWVGAMVADVHRMLCRGGVFLYPWDSRDPAKPGKLRLLYEVNPMSMLVEQAGGMATTGTRRLMDIEPETLHQRVPTILGSREEVERLIRYHRENG